MLVHLRRKKNRFEKRQVLTGYHPSWRKTTSPGGSRCNLSSRRDLSAQPAPVINLHTRLKAARNQCHLAFYSSVKQISHSDTRTAKCAPPLIARKLHQGGYMFWHGCFFFYFPAKSFIRAKSSGKVLLHECQVGVYVFAFNAFMYI